MLGIFFFSNFFVVIVCFHLKSIKFLYYLLRSIAMSETDDSKDFVAESKTAKPAAGSSLKSFLSGGVGG